MEGKEPRRRTTLSVIEDISLPDFSSSPFPRTAEPLVRETLSTMKGLLRLTGVLVNILQKTPAIDPSVEGKIDMLALKDFLLSCRPQNCVLGKWDSVFRDPLVLEKTPISVPISQGESYDENQFEFLISYHPDIVDYQNRPKNSVYTQQFTDLRAYKIIAVKELLPDLFKTQKECLSLVLNLLGIIETLRTVIVPVVQGSLNCVFDVAEIDEYLKRINECLKNSPYAQLRETLPESNRTRDFRFIQQVLGEGILMTITDNLSATLSQVVLKLPLIAQLHPDTSDNKSIHMFVHNAECLYRTTLSHMPEIKSLIEGDLSGDCVLKKGFIYVCTKLMESYPGISNPLVRPVSVQPRSRAQSIDLFSASNRSSSVPAELMLGRRSRVNSTEGVRKAPIPTSLKEENPSSPRALGSKIVRVRSRNLMSTVSDNPEGSQAALVSPRRHSSRSVAEDAATHASHPAAKNALFTRQVSKSASNTPGSTSVGPASPVISMQKSANAFNSKISYGRASGAQLTLNFASLDLERAQGELTRLAGANSVETVAVSDIDTRIEEHESIKISASPSSSSGSTSNSSE